MKKKLFILLIILPQSLLLCNDLDVNHKLLAVKSGFYYNVDTSNQTIYIHKNNELVSTINLPSNTKIRYINVINDEIIYFADFFLYKINKSGEILAKRAFPIGCIPKYIYIEGNYIFLIIPKTFKPETKSLVLDLDSLSLLGELGKNNNYFIINKDQPIQFDKFGLFLGFSVNYRYWHDRESNNILITKEMEIIKEIKLKDKPISNIFFDNKEIFFYNPQKELISVKLAQ